LADLGRVEINRKRPERALPYLREAYKVSPQDPYVRKYTARALYHLAAVTGEINRAEALKMLRQSLSLLPNQGDAIQLAQKLSSENDPASPARKTP
jgi:tetratricopeptide (TPR) repeat protein